MILGSRTLCWLAGAGRDVAWCGLAEVGTTTRPPPPGTPRRAEFLPRPVSGLPYHLRGGSGLLSTSFFRDQSCFPPGLLTEASSCWVSDH